ncbi:MAG: hypothetical protein K6D02_01400 [Lachnospiraceae bacterium]|nr:hypothetical protein [Lachnospiraceae bacterium]
MNSRKSLYDVGSFYNKGGVNKASFKGMRYVVEKVEDNLVASCYPDKFCIEKTPEEDIIKKEFPATEEGLDEVYDFLVKTYEDDKEKWEGFIGWNGYEA